MTFDTNLRSLTRPPSSGKLPKVLYHYTDAAGLQGILEKRKIWATHFEYTNDPFEFRHGQQLVEEETERTLKGLQQSSVHDAVQRALKKMKEEGLHDGVPTFVACFSEESDLLGQWRAYANNGRGYGIGFDTGRWKVNEANRSRFGIFLTKCEYDESKVTEWLRERHREIVEAGAKMLDSGKADAEQQVAQAMFMIGAYATIQLKAAAYREEKEWRLVALADETRKGQPDAPGLFVRAAEGLLVPTVALALESSPEEQLAIRRVTMGPFHAESRRSEYGLRQALRSAGVDAIPPGFIKPSKIPYRPGQVTMR